MTTHKKHCLIIGGTSGIGLALARDYLAKSWQVTIVGSNAKKIAALTQQYQHNLNAIIKQCNITNSQQRQRLFDELDDVPLNHVIYSAGLYHNERILRLSALESEQMLAVNLQAFCAVFEWASGQFKKQSGLDDQRLVAIASIAGMLEFEQMSLYARCKRAMIAICQAYAMAMQPHHIGVHCIACGYVDTQTLRQLNRGDASHKPFLCSIERAVKEIQYAITHNIALHVFPKRMKYLAQALSVLPNPILDKVMHLQYRHQDKNLN